MRKSISYYISYSILAIILLQVVVSCGLQYVPPTKPENLTSTRRTAIESQISKDFQKSEYQYYSIAFGITEIVKPSSYKKLDSLYNIKYRNEQRGQIDRPLEEEIKIQKLIVANDTNPIFYIENHVFELRRGDTSEFYSAKVSTDINDKIQETKILESVILPVSYSSTYKTYIYNESLFRSGTTANSQERAFYEMFKGRADELSGTRQNEFIKHTLDLMRLASENNTLQTVDLLKLISLKSIKTRTENDITQFNFDLINELSNAENEIIGYDVYVSLLDNNKNITHKYRIELNDYLEVGKFETLPL